MAQKKEREKHPKAGWRGDVCLLLGGGAAERGIDNLCWLPSDRAGKRKDTVDPGYFGAWKKVSRLGFILALYPGTTSLYYSLQHCCCRKRKRREGLFAVSLGRKVELAARRQPKNAFTLTASYQSGRAWCGGRVGLGKNVASTLAAGESDK